jgi:hypothetical protein
MYTPSANIVLVRRIKENAGEERPNECGEKRLT